MSDKNFWQNFGDAVKYARSTSAPDGGGAYYVTSQAKEELREQGKEEEAREIEKAETIGTVGGAIAGLTLGKGIPLITRGISAFRTAFPKVAAGIDGILTADGIRNLATENGIQKTINYIKDGNWGRAAASGTMDALDLLGGVGLVGDAARYSKKAYNRLLESLIRIGDDFSPKPISSTMTQLFSNRAKGLRYILFNNPELAYRLPYNYSGQNVLITLDPNNPSPAHKGDLIDVLFGKSDELVDTNGRVLAKMSDDISNVPEKTIQAFQTIPRQSNKLPKVLKFNTDELADILYVHRPIQNSGDLVKGVPQEIARSNTGRVDFTKIPFLPSSGIDPGHFGITAIKNNNGVNLFGHDVYHFSPSLYAKTHHPSKIIPKLNITAGQPFIAEWQIPKVESPLNFDIKIPIVPMEGVNYKTSGYLFVPQTPSEFSYFDLFQPQPFQKKRANFAIRAKK